MTNPKPFRPIFLIVAALCGFAASHPVVSDTLSIVYSGNLDGELEPCGCTEAGNMGGIQRRATLLDQLRKQNSDLIVFSAGGLMSSGAPGDQRRGKYVLKGFAALDYDAIALQWPDLAYGEAFATAAQLPWVASNWIGPTIARHKKVKRGKHTLAFFSWLAPEASPLRKMSGGEPLIEHDAQILQQSLADADSSGSITVLATTLPLARVNQLMPLDAIDILLIEANYEVYGEPFQFGKTLVLQPGSRGMRIGNLELHLTEDGDIAQWHHEVIPLPNTIADAPRLAEWYEAYNAEVKEAYLKKAALRKLRISGASPYAGAKGCRECHQSAYEIWQASRHPTAFKDLQSVGKAFDPACLPCHTVGFDQAGGFVDGYITSHLTSVQCESCHGPGRGHVASQGQERTANADWSREKICRQCHNRSHSPSFNVAAYWTKIAH